VWGGTADLDTCGVCGGTDDLCDDCAGDNFGTQRLDHCGTCDNSTANDCDVDCFGVWGGAGIIDSCSVCGGDNRSCTITAVSFALDLTLAGSASNVTFARAAEGLVDDTSEALSAIVFGAEAAGGMVRLADDLGWLNASAIVIDFRQFLEFTIRIPGTTMLYSNDTSRGRLAQYAFDAGMASALGTLPKDVNIIRIEDTARRRLQMPMLSVEWVEISFIVNTTIDAAENLYNSGFRRNFSLGVTAAGLVLPGLDMLTFSNAIITTKCNVTVTTAFPVDMPATQGKLKTVLTNTTHFMQYLSQHGAVRGTELISTLVDRVLVIDCTGVHNGPTMHDSCTVCGGNGSICADCAGVPHGPLRADRCGNCDANLTNDCRPDCSSVWGGDGEMNVCGVCDGDISLCFTWGCDGVSGSDLAIDACGVCGGNGTVCLDCNNVSYGTSEMDYCGVCDNDETNDCRADCFGVWAGNTTLDSCGVCAGDNASCLFSTHSIAMSMNANGSITRAELANATAKVAANASDFRSSTQSIENATVDVQDYLQTTLFQLRLPGIESMYDNISAMGLEALATSPDHQILQFIIGMALTLELPIANVSVLNVTTAPGCDDWDLIPYTGFVCPDFLDYIHKANIGCDDDLSSMSDLFTLPVSGTLSDYCGVTCGTCEEHLLGTPFQAGKGSKYAWVFIHYKVESNISQVATLQHDWFPGSLGWYINHIPDFDPIPGTDDMSLFNLTASESAGYEVRVELPCVDLSLGQAWGAPRECRESAAQLRAASQRCSATWRETWHWQLQQGLADAFSVQADAVTLLQTIDPQNLTVCLPTSEVSLFDASINHTLQLVTESDFLIAMRSVDAYADTVTELEMVALNDSMATCVPYDACASVVLATEESHSTSKRSALTEFNSGACENVVSGGVACSYTAPCLDDPDKILFEFSADCTSTATMVDNDCDFDMSLYNIAPAGTLFRHLCPLTCGDCVAGTSESCVIDTASDGYAAVRCITTPTESTVPGTCPGSDCTFTPACENCTRCAEFCTSTDSDGKNRTFGAVTPPWCPNVTVRTLDGVGVLNGSKLTELLRVEAVINTAGDVTAMITNRSFIGSLAATLNAAGPAIPMLGVGSNGEIITREATVVTSIEYTAIALNPEAQDMRSGLESQDRLLAALNGNGTGGNVTLIADARTREKYESLFTTRVNGFATIQGLVTVEQFEAAVVAIIEDATGHMHTIESMSFKVLDWRTAVRASLVLLGPVSGKVGDSCPQSCFTRCNNSLYAHLTDATERDGAPAYVADTLAQIPLTLNEMANLAAGVAELELRLALPMLLSVDCFAGLSVESEGGAMVDGCSVCGGEGLCLDCDGEPHGFADVDGCGTCDIDQTNDCRLDCRGEWAGTVFPDGCGVCGGRGERCYDCGDVPFGTSQPDQCCDSPWPLQDPPPWPDTIKAQPSKCCDTEPGNDCTQDCFGVWGGEAVIDHCDVCHGFNISCSDCHGIPYGNNSFDHCGECDTNSTNDCSQDCTGVWGGELVVDLCDVCGGNSSVCQGCDGVPNSDRIVDRCGDCGGNSSCVGCDNIPYSGLVYDTCGTCNGTVVPPDLFDPVVNDRGSRFDRLVGPLSGGASSWLACAAYCIAAGPTCRAVVGAIGRESPQGQYRGCFLGIIDGSGALANINGTDGFFVYARLQPGNEMFARLQPPLPSKVPASCLGCDGDPLSGRVFDKCGMSMTV
jgi:hypothetical protein